MAFEASKYILSDILSLTRPPLIIFLKQQPSRDQDATLKLPHSTP